ncbi:hypothetical protein K474DRAFT_1463268 [Panus rudis PR-1116 ss-1]|nr:hypothetical protein K474DRAFT_1463268 [Panus rudis PR-1116 ss-1]
MSMCSRHLGNDNVMFDEQPWKGAWNNKERYRCSYGLRPSLVLAGLGLGLATSNAFIVAYILYVHVHPGQCVRRVHCLLLLPSSPREPH